MILKNRLRFFSCIIALIAIFSFQFTGIGINIASANNTPQTLPFSQNWSNTGLITTSDDWSGVPGIVGFRGDDIVTTIGTDLQTILADGSTTPVDVNANQANPDTFTTGGVAEFEITNPVVALQGSGTADVPHIVIYLNTTGQSNIQFSANIRDVDGSADDAAQQVNVQYRVGGTGDYANVPGGYIADATMGGTATMVTPLSLTLPANANNQSLVEIRVMTINAFGSDEWVGIDDISVTAGPVVVPGDAPLDYNGDGKTDYTVVRNTGGGSGGQVTWFIHNGTTTSGIQWGISTDFFVSEDFDGDGKDDVTVFRPSSTPSLSNFYILQSSNLTVRIENFGLSGDDPTIVNDYDGDGKADVAVYRGGASAGQQSFWFYRGSLNNPSGNITYVPWGQNGDFPAPGDYDGDGRADYVVQRNTGSGQGRFWMNQTTAGINNSIVFGTSSDLILPGDYDGDGKTDICVARGSGGNIIWFYRRSSDGVSVGPIPFGLSATDFPTQGDYDGDGKTDIAIWRPNADATMTFFWVRNSSNGALSTFEWGQQGDYPVANFNSH